MLLWKGVMLVCLTLGAGQAARALDLSDPDWRWSLPEPFDEAQALTFRTLDVDRDAKLSFEEASLNPLAAHHFARGDLDRDRRLSALEYNNLGLVLAAAVR
jgi:hypothetical protein